MLRGALLALVVASGLICVFLGDLWRDENWYYAGSWLTANGQLPHVAFFTHHNPLFFYVSGLVQRMVGPSLLAGRLASWVCWSFSLLLLSRLAHRYGGPWAAVLFLVLVLTNPFATRYFTTLSWRPVELLLLTMAVAVLSSGRMGRSRLPIACTMMALVVALRFPIDLGTVMLGLLLAYVTVRFRKDPALVLWSYAGAAVVLAATLLPVVIQAPDRYFFDAVRYPLRMAAYQRSLGLLSEWNGPISSLFALVRLGSDELRFFFAAVLGFLVIVVCRGWELWSYRVGAWREWCRERGEWWWLAVVYVLLGEGMMIASGLVGSQGTPVTRIVPFVLASLVVAVEAARYLRAAAPAVRSMLAVTIGVLVALATLLQSPGESGLRLRWSQSDLFRVRQVAAAVAATAPPNRPVLTFDPVLATEADRPIGLNMVMEVWSVFPDWPTELCTRYHLTNMSLLLDAMTQRRMGAVVLSRPGRLEDDAGLGRVLRPYRDQLNAALEAGYRLAARVPGPREGRSVPVFVELYLAK